MAYPAHCVGGKSHVSTPCAYISAYILPNVPDQNKHHADAGDLTQLANEIEEVFENHFGERTAIAVAFSLERSPRQVHWVTNVSRTQGITLLTKTAAKMLSQTN